jgi:hypothetical protein
MAHWPWQELIVALIVAGAAGYVVQRYAPASVRRPLRAGMARLARALGLAALARRIEAAAEAGAACGSGCASCNSCGPREGGPSQGGPRQGGPRQGGPQSGGVQPGKTGGAVQGRITPDALKRTIRRA